MVQDRMCRDCDLKSRALQRLPVSVFSLPSEGPPEASLARAQKGHQKTLYSLYLSPDQLAGICMASAKGKLPQTGGVAKSQIASFCMHPLGGKLYVRAGTAGVDTLHSRACPIQAGGAM